MALAIEEFRSALYPVLGIQTDYESGLIVQRRIVAIYSGLENKISAGGEAKEVSIVGNIAVESFPPKIGLGAAANVQFEVETLP